MLEVRCLSRQRCADEGFVCCTHILVDDGCSVVAEISMYLHNVVHTVGMLGHGRNAEVLEKAGGM